VPRKRVVLTASPADKKKIVNSKSYSQFKKCGQRS
jgi:hypothetical protein